MSEACFAASGLSVLREGKPLLGDVSFEIHSGELACILGPNGAGKSTLLELLSGMSAPSHGKLLLFGKALSAYSRNELARIVAVVRQEDRVVPGFSVREVVAMGRSPYLRGWMMEGPEDARIVDSAIDRVGLRALATRTTETLSGGELRLVSFARALAQCPKVLLLDEPTAFLDLAREKQLFVIARDLAEEGVTVVGVVHDLHLDLAPVDRVLCLREGKLLGEGDPNRVLTGELLSSLYGADVVRLPESLGLRFALR